MNTSIILKRIVAMVTMVIALLLCWSLAYWVTTWFYESAQMVPNEWMRQLFSSLLGFFIFGLGVSILSRFLRLRSKQDQFLYPIIQALKTMSEGNFKVNLSSYGEQLRGKNGEHPYSQIINSINHMAEKLGEMEEMRQEFISNVSHEIQSPLTSISGFAHTLKSDELSSEERKHYLNIIETESNRLSKLSENLLKLTSLESEHYQPEQKLYRLDHQLRRIILAHEPQWTEKQINMDITLNELMITADEELMDQVWINLLHNSIKFTSSGGTITIEAFRLEEGRNIVKIKDTGIGIDQDALMHVFERFYKADKSRNRNVGGNGLGLSIVKKIIDLHSGEIRVQSEPGKGTEITVSVA